jgi:hypothetical protein
MYIRALKTAGAWIFFGGGHGGRRGGRSDARRTGALHVLCASREAESFAARQQVHLHAEETGAA